MIQAPTDSEVNSSELENSGAITESAGILNENRETGD
jgi:hypothetical protein